MDGDGGYHPLKEVDMDAPTFAPMVKDRKGTADSQEDGKEHHRNG